MLAISVICEIDPVSRNFQPAFVSVDWASFCESVVKLIAEEKSVMTGSYKMLYSIG